MLALKDLKVEYRAGGGTVAAVDRGTLEVARGQVVGLVGESGCGKTTLARAIIGVMPRNARHHRRRDAVRGPRSRAADEAERRDVLWREIAFVPQSAMNALDPVYRDREPDPRSAGRARRLQGERSRRRASIELFRCVGLDPGRQHDYPHQFSGGMRQRVGIALALALEPKLLIADEPVTALDVIVQRQVLDTLRDLQQRSASRSSWSRTTSAWSPMCATAWS